MDKLAMFCVIDDCFRAHQTHWENKTPKSSVPVLLAFASPCYKTKGFPRVFRVAQTPSVLDNQGFQSRPLPATQVLGFELVGHGVNAGEVKRGGIHLTILKNCKEQEKSL